MRSPSVLSTLTLLGLLATVDSTVAAAQTGTAAPKSGAIAERLSQLFLPRQECTKRPVTEWLERLRQSTGRDAHDALWCVYWTNDRSPVVIEQLNSIYACASPNLAREIDVVLTEWEVPHASAAPCWIAESSGGPATPEQVDLDFAGELGWHAEDLDSVLPERDWHPRKGLGCYISPRGLFAVPLRPVDLPNAELVRALDSTDRIAQAEAAVTLALRRQPVTRALRALLARDAADPEALRSPHEIKWSALTFPTGHAGDLERTLDIGFGIGWGWMRVGCAAQAWNAEQTTQMALSWIRSFAGSSAFEGTGLDALPKEPDFTPAIEPGYREQALTDVGQEGPLCPAQRTARLVRRLETCLARQEPTEPVLAELLAVVEPPYAADGAVGPMDHYFGFLNWLEAHTFSDPRITDWCLSIVASDWPYESHLRPAVNYLLRQRLDARQQEILCRYDEGKRYYSRRGCPLIRPEVFARQGKSVIEIASYLRQEAQLRQDLEFLDAVLAIAKPSPNDLEMLRAALARGVASERLRALQILDARGIDSVDLRASARTAREDLDASVRDLATRLVKARHW